ncbi:Fic family protein [Persicobacter sp. CCB-QB2]|uniref:Fic family protein n=1 Tax=Persicobacter sp. CCB-QB2 TaxID=1561025 RepID=UPI0006A9843D|nr:Fic/DOC family N-terminal domain-containing protein [Persicobacter sp. CCB-QB2]
MTYHKDLPYNALPPLPPKIDLYSKDIMVKLVTTSRALAQLNGALTKLPNPNLFLDTLYLQEAKASSEIENIVTTNDDLFKALLVEKRFANPANKEIFHYKKALWLGMTEFEQRPFITVNLCIKIVQCIKQNMAGIRDFPGTRLANSRGEVVYTPPEGEETILEKLKAWERYINDPEDDLDPLIKMSLMHYQFEAIHPFSDGNGRTGRILFLLYLKQNKLLDIPALFLSEYILKERESYYKKLRAVTEKEAWEDFILYMLDMVEITAKQALFRMESVIELMEKTSEAIKAEFPKFHSYTLMEVLFKLPYSKRQTLVEAELGTAKTVGNYLIKLEKAGYLKSVRVGKEKLYLNHRLMSILEGENILQ